ncbi:FAD-dependent oxidoreductase [Roseomonas sp. OT10]|uniref:FAD-dependent oxidoreductase n=1 Tax=Roseomonas cutis TaxID=2897332 RepID=UPI001E54A80A|nr:FAD-dependent oxidoreductase [Roseomonas sp. OT10]UFN49320.1 FAD-dependent oxidoreductase [Roseomonas sp. OT10]
MSAASLDRGRRALVVGGGIMGLCSAWALARDGWVVELVEQDPIPNPRGSSVDRHRLIRHAYGDQRGYMRMVDAAHDAWESVFADLGERPYRPTGTLALAGRHPPPAATGSTLGSPADHGEALGWLSATRAALREDGRPFEALSPDALARRLPFLDVSAVEEALYLPTGGVLLADRIVAGLARHLAARGVALRRARVAGVEPAAARVVLEDGTALSADLLVLAAGPWTARLLPGLAPRAVPSRQILVNLEPPPALRAGWEAAPMLLDLSGGFYAVPPVAGTPLKVGDHSFSLQGDPDDPREASPAEAEAILALALPRLRDAGAYRILSARACYYEVSPGERIALEPLGEGCLALCGTSGHGFKFGPALGQAVATAAAADPSRRAAITAWAAGEAA